METCTPKKHSLDTAIPAKTKQKQKTTKTIHRQLYMGEMV